MYPNPTLSPSARYGCPDAACDAPPPSSRAAAAAAVASSAKSRAVIVPPHALCRGATKGHALSSEASLNRLELLERLAAARAVAERPARRRAEEVLEPRLGRAAVGAAMHLRLQLDESRRRRGEPGGAQLLAARRRDLVGRPRVVLDDLDLGLRHLLLDRALHELERGAAEKRRRELHVDASIRDFDRTDDAEIDERDDGDLRVGDLLERGPDLLDGHHCAPAGAERRTIVISSCSAAKESSNVPRSTAATSSSPTRAHRSGR